MRVQLFHSGKPLCEGDLAALPAVGHLITSLEHGILEVIRVVHVLNPIDNCVAVHISVKKVHK